MADRVLIPLGPEGLLDLPRDVYERHLRSIAAPAPSPAPAVAKLLSAEEMEAATGVPASWFATQARERRIPFRKLGRYVRFSFDEVMACEAFSRRAIPPGQMHCTGHQDRNGAASG